MGGWMGEGVNRMWSTNTVDYDSAMKRSEALTWATVWMNVNTHCSAGEADTEGRTVLGRHSKTEGWGLQQQERISYSSGAQTSEIRASGWSGSGEALFLVGPGSSLRPHMEEGLRRPLGGLFHKSTNPIHGVSILTTSS